MSATADNSWSTVRSGPSWAVRTGVSVLAFSATAAAVYWIGLDKPDCPAHFAAAAVVLETGLSSDVQGNAQTHPTADLRLVQREATNHITSEASLRRALAQMDPRPDTTERSDPIPRLRRNLNVSIAQSSTPARLEITVGCSGEDPRQAVRLVNRLAEQFAQDRRHAAEATVLETCRQIEQQQQAAQQELLSARANLEQFLLRHFQEHHSRAESLAEASVAIDSSVTNDSPAMPPMVENPAWKMLARQRQDLLDHRAHLLATRTSQHPTVGEVDRKIAKLKALMARVPQQVPDEDLPAVVAHPMIDAEPMQPPPDGPAEPRPSTASGQAHPALTAEEHGQAALDFFALKAARNTAQEDYDRLDAAHRGAIEQRLDLPSVEVRLAQLPNSAEKPAGSARLMLVALAAGLAMAAGAAMSFNSPGSDLTLESVAQAQAALPVPIVGAIPNMRTLPPREGG